MSVSVIDQHEPKHPRDNFNPRKAMLHCALPLSTVKNPGVILLESEGSGSKLGQIDTWTQYQGGNLYLTYTPRLGDNHSLTVLAGWNVEQQKTQSVNVQRKGIILKDKPSFSLMNGTLLAPSAGGNVWAYAGAFFRAEMGFLPICIPRMEDFG